MERKRFLPWGIKIKPILMGSAIILVGSKLMVDKVGEIRSWHQLAETRDLTTEGYITNSMMEMASSSGKVRAYKVSYEFTAPGGEASGADSNSELSSGTSSEALAGASSGTSSGTSSGISGGGGSSTSAAEVNAYLQEQFWNPGTTASTSDVSAETVDAGLSAVEPDVEIADGAVSDASVFPEGELFFRGSQRMTPEDYRDLYGRSTLPVVYDGDDPSNNAIAVAYDAPSVVPILIIALFFVAGGWLLWNGVRLSFVDQSSNPQASTID